MKKLFVVTMLLLSAGYAAHSQEFKKFKVGVGLGYAIPSGEGVKGGVLFTLEPAYRLSDAVLIGLRMETAILAAEEDGVDISALGSYALTGQYYFTKSTGFRPFLGAGAGLFTVGGLSVDDGQGNELDIDSETKFGFFPRVGFDAGHFTLALDYNIIGESELGDKNSYIGIRASVAIGGGRK